MRIEIPFRLPGLNEYVSGNRRNKYAGNAMKQGLERDISLFIRASGAKPVQGPVTLHFTWYEPTRRRDKDNVAFAKKFILDALQKCGVLPNDNNRYLLGFTDTFVYRKGQKVVVELEEGNEGCEDDGSRKTIRRYGGGRQ